MNLPNKLTVFRIILVPVVMIFILLPDFGAFPETWSNIFAAALFLIASLTDLADGIIARKMKLVTNFGKLMDPLADKFLIVGAMIAITASGSFENIRALAVWVTAVIFFREFAVTSIRLVANEAEGNVIAANFAGKLKTVSQCVCILVVLLEKVVISERLGLDFPLFSYITMIIMTALTLYSGFVYVKKYWKYINPSN